MVSPAAPGRQVTNPDHDLYEYVEITTVEEEVELGHSTEKILASDGFEPFKYWAFSNTPTFEPIN